MPPPASPTPRPLSTTPAPQEKSVSKPPDVMSYVTISDGEEEDYPGCEEEVDDGWEEEPEPVQVPVRSSTVIKKEKRR
jgi:hypothetical protein